MAYWAMVTGYIVWIYFSLGIVFALLDTFVVKANIGKVGPVFNLFCWTMLWPLGVLVWLDEAINGKSV